MKKVWLLGIFIGLILACNTAQVQMTEIVPETAVNLQATVIPRIEADTLEAAIREVSDYLNKKFPQGRRRIAILNIQSDFPTLSNRIIDMLTDNAVNDDVFRTVNRQQLDIIRGEINFNQTSGEVSRQTLQRAGQFAGAEIVIIGDVVRIGDIFQLRVQALGVQTALIEGHIMINITNNSEMALYTGLPVRTSSAAAAPDPFDEAIRRTADYLNQNLVRGNRLAILNIQSDFPALSEQIIKELTDHTVNDGVFRVVSRHELDVIRGEINFNQTSGEVSRQTLQRAGQFTGAQTVIIGDIKRIGDTFQLRIQALGVESALIDGHTIQVISNSRKVSLLTGRTMQTVRAGTDSDPLDTAIREIADYMNGRIAPRSRLAILDIQSDFPALSDEIIKRLTNHTVNDRIFQVVNRQDIDIIRGEIGEQNTTGEVSRETLQRAGRMTGAQTIVIGRVSQVGDIYELRIQALDVQSILIKGHIIREISNSSAIASLTGTTTRSVRAARAEPLNDIIREAADYLNDRRSIRGNRIAILDIESDVRGLADVPELERYILYRLIDHTVNDQVFNVVNRHDLDAARGELQIHHGSGEVSEETRLRVGQLTGAQTLVVGRISQFGNEYRLRIQAFGVEEGLIEGSREWTIPSSPVVSLLTQRAVRTRNVATGRIDAIWNSAVSGAQSARRQELNSAWWQANKWIFQGIGGVILVGGMLILAGQLNSDSENQ